MPGERYREALGQWSVHLAARLRQRSSIYLGLSLIARVLNALGMFIAIQRFAPSSFGEMSYLQATAVAVVAFCAFGVEISINAQLTRKLKEQAPLGPTILAGAVLAVTGAALACLVICGAFAPQLNLSSSPGWAIVSVCVYSTFMIFTSLLTAISFALDASINVGISYLLTSGIFVVFAIFANNGTSGVDLQFFFICAQLIAVPYMALALLRHRIKLNFSGAWDYLRSTMPATRIEVTTLFTYGVKQILVVSAVTFSQWLIQRKIVFGEGGTSENAIYSIGNQIFNMMTFIPLIITPLVITRLAAAGSNVALRRAICLRSLRLFTVIALCACVAVFIGLRVGVPYLPPRYAVAVETGLIAAGAAAFQIMRSPFSLFFLSELKASREIISATSGALFMIIATSLFAQLTPNQGTMIRLLGCALQAILLGTFFLIETRARTGPSSEPVAVVNEFPNDAC
jgi:O-antigen/teichoic acid export membrane protein